MQTNSSLYRDLAMEVIAADGTTVLASADLNPAGVDEQLSFQLGSGGGYLRVFANASASTQIYDLEVTLAPEPSAALAAGTALMVLGILVRARR